jgi:hypothetical protein
MGPESIGESISTFALCRLFMERIMYISDSLNAVLSITRQNLWNMFLPILEFLRTLIAHSNTNVSLITDQNCPNDYTFAPYYQVTVQRQNGVVGGDPVWVSFRKAS